MLNADDVTTRMPFDASSSFYPVRNSSKMFSPDKNMIRSATFDL